MTADTAGRELDVLIAQAVMGWQRIPLQYNPEQPLVLPPGVPSTGTPQSPDSAWWLGRNVHTLVPHYSTDIAAAWELVAHLREAGWLVRVQEMPDGRFYRHDMTGEPTFSVRSVCMLYPIAARDRGDWKASQHQAYAASTPLAICQAALATVASEPTIAKTP